MNTWLSQALTKAELVQDSLSLKRQQSLQLLKNTPWPTRKTEAWKYTPLRALENLDLQRPAANADVTIPVIEQLDSIDVVFIDGVLQSPLDQPLPDGLHLYRLDDGSKQAMLSQLFASVKPTRHYFGLVNDVLATNGVFIDVSPNCKIQKPIRIVSILSEGAEAHVRLLVNVGEGAELTVIEQAVGNQPSVNTLFSEYKIQDRAKLQHYRLALQSQQAITLAGDHFQLNGESELNSNILAFGSQLSRLDLDIIHGGEHSTAKLNCIYLLDKQELFDLHSCVEHTVAHGKTEENVRGIVGGEAKAVFNGRIHIHQYAQKTDAKLNNRNLLLSNRAEVDTKPELEIYADDVRCAHGATVAQMDERSLYYLQSRGIDREQAQAMLTIGFINELLEQMPIAAVSEWLRPQIRERFNAAFKQSS